MTPREFWIIEDQDFGDLICFKSIEEISDSSKYHAIHVIEYSAVENMKNNYFQLMAENAKLIEKLTEQNKIMREALEEISTTNAENPYWAKVIAQAAFVKCGSTEPTTLKARIVMKGDLPPLPFDGEKDE